MSIFWGVVFFVCVCWVSWGGGSHQASKMSEFQLFLWRDLFL